MFYSYTSRHAQPERSPRCRSVSVNTNSSIRVRGECERTGKDKMDDIKLVIHKFIKLLADEFLHQMRNEANNYLVASQGSP